MEGNSWVKVQHAAIAGSLLRQSRLALLNKKEVSRVVFNPELVRGPEQAGPNQLFKGLTSMPQELAFAILITWAMHDCCHGSEMV